MLNMDCKVWFFYLNSNAFYQLFSTKNAIQCINMRYMTFPLPSERMLLIQFFNDINTCLDAQGTTV